MLDGTATTQSSLDVPKSGFNDTPELATQIWQFTATGPTFSQTYSTTSDKIVVFRAVLAPSVE